VHRGIRRAPRRALDEVVGIYWDSGIGDDVPALAWFLVSSLVPLALGVTAITAIVLGDYTQAQSLTTRIAQVLPKDVHDQIVELILRTKRDSPLLLTVSAVVMIWTASGAVGVIARSLGRVLGASGPGIVLGKLRNLAVAATLAVLIVLMLVVASAGTGLIHRLEVSSLLVRLVVPLLAFAITLLICGGAYLVLAQGSLRWHAAFAGGGVAAFILQATPTAAGYYLRLVAGNTPVELFLMLAGVLITCYIAAFGLLLGAGISARVQLGRRLGRGAPTRADASPEEPEQDAQAPRPS
jgi:uncharacterized BrkB/YihY/UPF0761 family membrane protein